MEPDLKPGLVGEFSLTVEERHLAINLGSGDTRVFATPMLVAGVEAASVEAIRERLPAGLTSVGVHIDARHNAATPPGMRVHFRSELVKIEGRRLFFRASAKDDAGDIGEASHERVIVDKEKFESRALAKGAPGK